MSDVVVDAKRMIDGGKGGKNRCKKKRRATSV